MARTRGGHVGRRGHGSGRGRGRGRGHSMQDNKAELVELVNVRPTTRGLKQITHMLKLYNP